MAHNVDSFRNEHRLKNNYPSKRPGGILGVLGGQKFKNLE